VILDFGLVKELASQPVEQSLPLVGTPAYMAPEQITGGTISEAADWYAVGVMLYKALTGQFPFHGGWAEILERKQKEPSPIVRHAAPHAPADLQEACQCLLQVDPSRRLRGISILLSPAEQARTMTYRPQEVLVGRGEELAFLQDKFSGLLAGNRQMVLL
jgi:eukaryotic-like serine/threonine-protein kinase